MSNDKEAKPVSVDEKLVALIIEGLEINPEALWPLSKRYDADVWNPAMYVALERYKENDHKGDKG